MKRQTGTVGDELTNAALVGLVGVFAVGLVLRGAGSVAALISGTAPPTGGQPPVSQCSSIPPIPPARWAADGLNVVVYWAVSGVLLIATSALSIWVWARIRRHQHRVETDPHHLADTATRHGVTLILESTSQAGEEPPPLAG